MRAGACPSRHPNTDRHGVCHLRRFNTWTQGERLVVAARGARPDFAAK